MKTKGLLRAFFAMALSCFVSSGFAVFDPVNDDTDIFLANPTYNVQRPNVLIILDSTANWNTPFAAEKTALVNALNSLNQNFNVGLMMFTETGTGGFDASAGTGNTGNDGAYVRYGVRQMTDANKTVLTSIVNDLHNVNDRGNAGKAAMAMYEAYLYFGGRTAYAGSQKAKTDYAGHPSHPARNLDRNAFASGTNYTYTSPITDGCQKNFIIYISNGKAQDNTADLTTAENALREANNNIAPSTIPLRNVAPDNDSQQGNWADEWARHMATADCHPTIEGDQHVITYVLDVGPSKDIDPSVQGAGWTTLLKSMAVNGKGNYFAINNNDPDTASQLEAALKTIFSEVQAVNSVFASTTLPVSVNVRGTNLNQVYIGVFRPDSDKNPRWLGNLKMYKLAVVSGTDTVFLADANGVRAENETTGFISNSATSFWTASSCFWKFRNADPDSSATVPSSCDPATIQNEYPYWSDRPDGDKVEKGGAAQRLRTVHPISQGSRNVYTCTSASGGICAAGEPLSATPFSAGGSGYPSDNADIAAADIGAYTTYTVSSLGSSGTTATVTLSTTPSPAFADGDTVRIEGATPSDFNKDAAISNVTTVGSGISFQYTLGTTLPSDVAIVTTTSANQHQMNTGDLVEATGGAPSDYQRTDVPITRLSATQFTYNLAGNAPSAATTLPTVVGKKTLTAVSGSGTSATATIPAHGYTGVSVANFSLTGSSVSAFNVTNVTATVVNANTVTFTTASTITGSAGSSNAVRVTTTGPHELQPGDSVTISGLSNSGSGSYNGTYAITSVPSSTSFEYIPTTAPGSAASGTASITATRSFTLSNAGSTSTAGGINNGSGGNRNAAFGRTPSVHNVTAANWTVTVAGVTNDTDFNRTGIAFTIPSTNTSTGFNYAMAGNADANLNAQADTGSITATFTRNSFTVSNSGFVQVVADTASGMKAAHLITPSTVAVQSNATGTITAGRPSDYSTDLRAQIINWVRGADNREDENISGSTSTSTDVRASVHGDVLHSRPAVVNYNRYSTSTTTNDNDIYAFYGGNDGMLHALKGGLGSDESGVSAGDERWSFIPREFFSKLKRLRNNSPLISSANPRTYLGDGPVSVYQLDANGDGKLTSGDGSGDKVYLYFAVRRGGRFIYALDVTDPAAPKFLWRKSSADTGYAELGQTWSEPKVAKVRINVSTVDAEGNTVQTPTDKVVLIFGGGYDPIDDLNPCLLQEATSSGVLVKPIGTGTIDYTAAGSCVINNATGTTTPRTRSQGRAIFIVDAETGSVFWQAGPAPVDGTHNKTVSGMTCAIPSDITVIDIDREGRSDRGYVGDMCGNAWRIDIGDLNPANWGVYKIASLSSTTATDIPNQRKFLFPPDVVFSKDTTGSYAAILIGSGDREHPFDTTVINRFYMIKDRTSGGLFTSAESCTATSTAGAPVTDAALFDATNEVADKANPCGFKLTFNAGEKNVGGVVTLAGTTFFNTNQPSATAGGGACGSNLGIARQYLIDFEDASATADLSSSGTGVDDRSVKHEGGGFLPSPVPAVVELEGKKYEVVISGTAVKQPTGTTLDVRARTYWYKEFD